LTFAIRLASLCKPSDEIPNATRHPIRRLLDVLSLSCGTSEGPAGGELAGEQRDTPMNDDQEDVKSDRELLIEWVERVEHAMREPVAFVHESHPEFLDEVRNEIDAALSRVREGIKLGQELERIRTHAIFNALGFNDGPRVLQKDVPVSIDGTWKTVGEWSEQVGIPVRVISRRMNDGWTYRDAVFTPYGRRQEPRYQSTQKAKATTNG